MSYSSDINLGGVMDIQIIFQVGAIGILVAIFKQILANTGRDEYAMLVTLTGVIVILAFLVSLMNDLFVDVRAIFNLY